MHQDGFVLFNASITADTATADFDTSNYDAFILRMTLANLGASQGCRPQLQARLPDGTYATIASPSVQQTTNSSFLYQFGRTVAGGSVFTETLPMGVPKVCRVNLDVVNGTNADVKIEILPCAAR